MKFARIFLQITSAASELGVELTSIGTTAKIFSSGMSFCYFVQLPDRCCQLTSLQITFQMEEGGDI
jgi:hypothetical protein